MFVNFSWQCRERIDSWGNGWVVLWVYVVIMQSWLVLYLSFSESVLHVLVTCSKLCASISDGGGADLVTTAGAEFRASASAIAGELCNICQVSVCFYVDPLKMTSTHLTVSESVLHISNICCYGFYGFIFTFVCMSICSFVNNALLLAFQWVLLVMKMTQNVVEIRCG